MKRLRYRNKDKKEILSCLILVVLTGVFVGLFVLRLGVFGSKVDWISQHSVLPDYFRQQFYETGKLFSEFAPNIGGGQNIYNFAYYGLYSPVILPSYLLPFMKMSDYMMLMQLLCLTASVLLLYGWLRERGFARRISFCLAVMFLLAGPMIYHSYNQIMFVNYMPFLCMGFLGVDRYFDESGMTNGKKLSAGERRRSGLLLISIFLMVMTSFYFSIGGMLALVVYGIHRYAGNCMENGQRITFRGFLEEGIRFAVPFLLAVMLSGVLLVPAAMALTGRGGAKGADLADLLLPQVSLDEFFYAPYGIGLTTLCLTALIAMMFSVRFHERVLAWCLTVILTVPVFVWLLNGGLYIRTKVLIPFLPLLLYMTACYVRDLETASGGEKESGGSVSRREWSLFLPYLLSMLYVYMGKNKGDVGKYWELVFLDGFVMLCGFFLLFLLEKKFHKRRNVLVLLLPAIVFLVLYGAGLHTKADYAVDRMFYREITDTDVGELIGEVTGKEKGFYRTEQAGTDEENAADLNRVWDMGQHISSVYSSAYNEEYQKFRQETFELEQPFRNFLMQSAARNPVYLDLMGVKYLVSKEELDGYKPAGNQGKWKVYENEDALPVIYTTDQVIGEEEYRQLAFPYNQLALREYAVVQKENGSVPSGGHEENGIKLRGQQAAEDAPGNRTGESVKEEIDTEKIDIEEINIDFPEEILAKENKEFVLDISGADILDTDIPGADMIGTAKKSSNMQEPGQRVLFLQFQVKNQKPSKDITVWVSGARNKLTSRQHFYYNENTTFTYAVLLTEGQTEVPVTFGKGEYEISDVRCFVGRLSAADKGAKLCQAEFEPDKVQTKGNVIAGRIDVKSPGYLITSIPYDENFEIRIDGEKMDAEKVNTAFLGCRVEEGEHAVRVIYHAPGVRTGKIVSVAGIVLLGICIYIRIRTSKLLAKR